MRMTTQIRTYTDSGRSGRWIPVQVNFGYMCHFCDDDRCGVRNWCLLLLLWRLDHVDGFFFFFLLLPIFAFRLLFDNQNKLLFVLHDVFDIERSTVLLAICVDGPYCHGCLCACERRRG